MEVTFDIQANCGGELTITGTSTYVNPKVTGLTYENSVTINIITLEEKDSTKYIGTTYSTHEIQLDEVSIDIKKDGFYNVTELIVPSYDWYKVNKNISKKRIIVSDGKKLLEIKGGDIIALNPTDFVPDIDLTNTTVEKGQKACFVSSYLYNCYISLCLDALKELAKFNHGNKIVKCGGEDEYTIYKRDFIWATINVINYLVEDLQFDKALEILEKVTSCNGFCSSNTLIDTSSETSHCGCNNR